MRRVLIFTPGLDEVGGAAAHSSLVIRGFVERGWDVRVLSRVAGSGRLSVERGERCVVVKVPGFGLRIVGALLYYLVATPLGLFWARRASGILAIQMTAPAVVAGVVSRLTRKVFLVWSTTSGLLGETRYLQTSRLGWLRLRSIRSARWVLAQTPEAAAELSGILSPEAIVIVPTPFPQMAAPALEGKKRVLFAGRLAEEKNLFVLLDAWLRLRSAIPDAELSIAGTGGMSRSVETELRRKVRDDPRLQESVSFLGWVKDMASLYAAFDVFVLPSTTEGLSNALGEACATGRVIVASDIPSNAFVLGDSYPLLFDPRDVDQLARALERALLDPETRSRARTQAMASAERFSAPVVLHRIETLMHTDDRSRVGDI